MFSHSKNVDLPEWSKGTGLGPVMFACAGSNPAVNTPDLICSITNVPIAQWLRRLSTEQEILGSSPSRDYSLLAQLVERGSNKPKVTGSIPVLSNRFSTIPLTKVRDLYFLFFFCLWCSERSKIQYMTT